MGGTSIFRPTSLKPFFSKRAMISPTCPRWTPSGLTARKVLSYTITIESNNLHEASDSIYFYLWSCHRGGVTGIPAFLHIHHLFINLLQMPKKFDTSRIYELPILRHNVEAIRLIHENATGVSLSDEFLQKAVEHNMLLGKLSMFSPRDLMDSYFGQHSHWMRVLPYRVH